MPVMPTIPTNEWRVYTSAHICLGRVTAADSKEAFMKARLFWREGVDYIDRVMEWADECAR